MAEWRLLPAEPTEDQLRAGNSSALSTETLMDDARFACERATYRAMYAAAPSPSPADDLREKVARAIKDADEFFGYNMDLIRLVDGVYTYRLRIAGESESEYSNTGDCRKRIAEAQNRRRADRILALLQQAGK